MMKKKLFILKLNEFRLDLLKKHSKKYNLKYIASVLKFNNSKSITKDKYIGAIINLDI